MERLEERSVKVRVEKRECRTGAQTVLYQNNYGALYTVIVQVVSNKWKKPLFKPHTIPVFTSGCYGRSRSFKKGAGKLGQGMHIWGFGGFFKHQTLRKPSNHPLPEPGKVLHETGWNDIGKSFLCRAHASLLLDFWSDQAWWRMGLSLPPSKKAEGERAAFRRLPTRQSFSLSHTSTYIALLGAMKLLYSTGESDHRGQMHPAKGGPSSAEERWLRVPPSATWHSTRSARQARRREGPQST